MGNNYGLGRGLASLIPDKKNASQATAAKSNNTKDYLESTEEKKSSSVLEVDINLIDPNPHQPRVQFDEEKIAALAQSIRHHGIIQPLIVSRSGGRYELIAGERRYLAAKKAELGKVPVIVREAKEKEKLELALVENIQRHNLNPVEEAKAYKKLSEVFQMSQEEIAERVGKSRSAVANKMRLLGLPVEIQRAIIDNKISEGHAKAILAITNPEKQRAFFELILKQNLTVRQAENKVRDIEVKAHRRRIVDDPAIKELENKLMGILGTKVKVAKTGKGGKIIIDYYSDEELDDIIRKLT